MGTIAIIPLLFQPKDIVIWMKFFFTWAIQKMKEQRKLWPFKRTRNNSCWISTPGTPVLIKSSTQVQWAATLRTRGASPKPNTQHLLGMVMPQLLLQILKGRPQCQKTINISSSLGALCVSSFLNKDDLLPPHCWQESNSNSHLLRF